MLDLPFTAALEIHSRMADVRLASEWLARSGADGGVPGDELGRLDMCLNEALANVLAHGGQSAAAHAIGLQLQVSTRQNAGQASVHISDAGPAFDATSARPKLQASTLADATPGGLGLLLIQKNADALSYQRLDGRNLLTITVRWA